MKETVVVYVRILSQDSPEETMENHEKSHDSQ
jgi:hypothetical protein